MKFRMFLATATLLSMMAVTSEVSCANTSASFYAQPCIPYFGKSPTTFEMSAFESEARRVLISVSGWKPLYSSNIFDPSNLRNEPRGFGDEIAEPNSATQKVVEDNTWEKALTKGWIEPEELTLNINKLWKVVKAYRYEVSPIYRAAPESDPFNINQWTSQLPLRGEKTGHT